MQLTGSDVAKQAADIVLMDDNFASIVKGIEQGRLLFNNLKKMIVYTLPHLLPEIYPPLYNFIVGLPLGLTTLQVRGPIVYQQNLSLNQTLRLSRNRLGHISLRLYRV
jgi:hypothetical protein